MSPAGSSVSAPGPEPSGPIEAGTLTVDGVEVFFRRTGGEGAPAVFVHGNPTNSDDWLPFLERLRRPGLAFDLPGWGRSGRPRDFDYSMAGLATFVERFLAEIGVGDHALVVHDWGSLALIGSQRAPERVERLVVVTAVPLLPGYRWHRTARIWRTPGLGELFNLTVTRRALALALRESRADRCAPPEQLVASIWDHLDRGTRRAILALYRSADPDALAAAGEGLGRLDCPSLVVWGERDPYIPVEMGRAYAERLGAELVAVPDAGHWPWHERPDLIERITGFLDGR